MIDLNDKALLEKIDPQNTLGGTELLLKQCETAWNEVTTLDLPTHLGEITNIVFCGRPFVLLGLK